MLILRKYNNMKNKLIISVAALAISSLFIVGFVFAWFRAGDNINELSFQIARINSEITLYKADDCNFNGIPDLDTDGNYKFGKEIGHRYANTSDEETTEDIEYTPEKKADLEEKIREFNEKIALDKKKHEDEMTLKKEDLSIKRI